MSETSSQSRKIAVLGAGPVGLEAALALANAGHDVQVYEQGRVAESVRQWGHVKLFSPWELNVSDLGLKALGEMDVSAPDPTVFPTGNELVARYLEPLSEHPSLKGRIHTGTKVLSMGRQGVLKGELIASASRRERPFRILVEDAQGNESLVFAEVVVDSTGTFSQPNALGDAGIPAPGERKARASGQIMHDLPDVQGEQSAHFAGKHVVVVGAGYSAITNINNLLELKKEAPQTQITWLTRKDSQPYQRIDGDPLPQRDALAALGNTLAGADQRAAHIGGVSIEGVKQAGGQQVSLELRGADGSTQTLDGVDVVLANVGYQPDLSLYRELQVHQCYASEGPMKLAAALLAASGGGGGDCLAQSSPGPDTLKSPEPDFFVLGSKSYGRGSSFLLKLGLEQIRDVMTLI